ncbi:MAG: TRAP transporter large permease [Alphaproteobacteria bacterium]|nr:TRAP transporter large permease [Alphaproteobacteria bacterium]MDX5369650.1 TRAP transporter large permease [Alphaproteobacteria bacterium]MDX5464285.1 TRAP transporter large permease [Alphaproteobacteria bacterium]
MIVTGILILMAVLFLMGVPVAFTLGISGAVGLWLVGGEGALMGLMATAPYRTTASWLLTAIPLFVLMAELLASSRITTLLFNTANKWVAHFPGGLAIAGIFTAAGLGAVSGSSTASTAAMSQSVTPELIRHGYSPRLAVGTIASAGTLAVMIPPSIILVIYGILTESSIGLLFVAGIVPGLLSVLFYVATVVIYVKRNPGEAPPAQRYGWGERIAGLKDIWPMMILFVLVIGGLYTGIVTVTESAGIGAFGALLLAIWFQRGRSFAALWEALRRTVATVAMIFAIVIGAHIFGYFMTLTGAPQHLLHLVDTLDMEPWTIILILLVIYVILGCFMDQLAILVLTVPIVLPMVERLGYDAIWFGIILVKTVEIGLMTPPLGMNCFVASAISRLSIGEVFRGTIPFVIAELVILTLLATVPGLVTWVIY